jgi:uncharacterized protein YcbK (DUF882 family)
MVSPGTRVRLVDAHTGTVFDGSYRDARGPIAQAMNELCLFLRDQHTGGMTNIDVRVIDFVAGVTAAIGQPNAIVLSAYRSLQTNARLAHTQFGVADNSQHLYGRALDISFPEAKLEDAVAVARSMKRGGVGWYPRSKFIHIDVGPVRNWELGAEGLQDQLFKELPATPIPPKGSGVMMVEGRGGLTVGGGKAPVVSSGRTIQLAHHRVAGLLTPVTKPQ